MRWIALLLALGLWLGTVAPSAAADDAELSAWRERLDSAEAELTNAQSRVAAAETAYVNMRHDRSIRGDKKGKIIAARGEAQRALAAARENLDAVREDARRAGAPPEWVLPSPDSEPPADQ